MGGGIGRVDKLAGDKAVGDLLCQLLRLGDGPLHPLDPFGEYQLRAVGLHQLAALHAHGLRHGDDDAVTPGRRHGGQADPGVAGGGLDDDRAGLQLAAGLRLVDHRLGNAVFYRPGGIEILQLSQNAGFQPRLLLNAAQLQQGRLADQLVGGCVDIGHIYDLLSLYLCFARWSRIDTTGPRFLQCGKENKSRYRRQRPQWPAISGREVLRLHTQECCTGRLCPRSSPLP